MSPRTLGVCGLLLLGVGIQWLCAVGMLVFRSPFERLHLLGPANGLGALSIVLAVALDTPMKGGGVKALVVGAVMLVTSPVLSHAVARAATLRERAPEKPGDVPEVGP